MNKRQQVALIVLMVLYSIVNFIYEFVYALRRTPTTWVSFLSSVFCFPFSVFADKF